MNLTQTIEATLDFWAAYYEIISIALPVKVYNQVRQENFSGQLTARLGHPLMIVEGIPCFQIKTGNPLPTVDFREYESIQNDPALAFEEYKRGLVSMENFRQEVLAEFVDKPPPDGLVWES